MISKFNLNKLYNATDSYLQDRFNNLYPIVVRNDLMRIYDYKRLFINDYIDYFDIGINNLRINVLDYSDIKDVFNIVR